MGRPPKNLKQYKKFLNEKQLQYTYGARYIIKNIILYIVVNVK